MAQHMLRPRLIRVLPDTAESKRFLVVLQRIRDAAIVSSKMSNPEGVSRAQVEPRSPDVRND